MTDRPAKTDNRLIQHPLSELLRLGESAVEAAIREDLAAGDPTSEPLFDGEETASAVLVAREAGIVAGLPVAANVFETVDAAVRFEARVAEGEHVEPGAVLAELSGPSRSLLAAERTALNFVQRMSGIATLTARHARAIATDDAVLLDTRKTAPGLRALDKYAVRVGGGRNHRLSLAELGMIKDTHVAATGDLATAIAAVRKRAPSLPLEVEVRTPDELDPVLTCDPVPDRILLDNFEPDDLRRAVARVDGRAITEASGGVTLETIGAVAATGVDAISVGALTHSPRALDVSMEIRGGDRGSTSTEIASVRRRLGGRVVLLVHHYQRDAIVAHADIVGDSLALARAATEQAAETIVFCGVRFMGETAAILCRDDQRVVMPVPDAGCFLADCADLEAIETAWRALGGRTGTDDVTPVTYVNSSAALKAFCGRHDGIVCTSANASEVLRWALARTERVLFLPDRHLGTNAAIEAGVPRERIAVLPPVGSESADEGVLAHARVLTWRGACDVHRRFHPEDVARIRASDPDAAVIVHPECTEDVVRLADRSGSTSAIIAFVNEAPAGKTIAIGTEARLVRRLHREHPDKQIVHLSDVPPFCRTMTKTGPNDLLETLREIESNDAERRTIAVGGETATWARVALERMLEI